MGRGTKAEAHADSLARGVARGADPGLADLDQARKIAGGAE